MIRGELFYANVGHILHIFTKAFYYFFIIIFLINLDTIYTDIIFSNARYDHDSENYEWAKNSHLQAEYEALETHSTALV